MNAVFDGDSVHKATSIHLQIDVQSMLENLPKTATVYVQNENELEAVGATNNLRGLAANIKFIFEIVEQDSEKVKKKNSDRDDVESDFYNAGVKYSERVTDKDTLSFLDSQETITTYKTMQIVDGKLYPPMAARIDGKHEDYSVLGVWEQATEHPELIQLFLKKLPLCKSVILFHCRIKGAFFIRFIDSPPR